MSMSLDDLKAENAPEEATELEVADGQQESEEATDDVVDTESEELDDDSETEETESWMVGEEKSVPLSKHVELRSKLKSERNDLRDEVDKLKQELEKVRQAPVEHKATLVPPDASKFKDEYGDIDFEKFNEANAKYLQDLTDSRVTNYQKKDDEAEKANRAKAERDTKVNGMYERAKDLVNNGKVKAEDYQQADSTIVSALEPYGQGKVSGRDIADGLIYALSEVSDEPEKVWFALSKNPRDLQTVIDAYQLDPTGTKGVATLAKLDRKYVKPISRKSNAPAPTKKVQGDAKLTGGALERKLKKKYEGAKSSQDRWNARKEARAAGIDVNKW